MNHFTWCDLSTFDLAKGCAFYEKLFGWTSQRNAAHGGEDDYTTWYAGDRAAAGVYTMPEFFQSIGMPSFWMSYVRVESLDKNVERAKSLGARCEIEPTAFDPHSRFALIRDPAGAGFTLYEGPDLAGRDPHSRHGRMCWNELHVPSLASVGPFYEELFGWQITPDSAVAGRHAICSPTGEPIASILELDEATKGPKNYWAVLFAVDDIDTALQAVVESGGSIVMRPGEGVGFAMVMDDQDAMFCLSAASAQ